MILIKIFLNANIDDNSNVDILRKGEYLRYILNQVRCIMAEVDELNRQIQIREMRREKLEVN